MINNLSTQLLTLQSFSSNSYPVCALSTILLRPFTTAKSFIMSFTDIATQFTDFYYKAFGENRGSLKALYRPHSMLTFETNEVFGDDKIIETLTNLPLGKVQHKVATVSAQPCGEDGRILVMVTGHLALEDSPHPQGFSQVFSLIPDGGSYYVLNDLFKLTFPA